MNVTDHQSSVMRFPPWAAPAGQGMGGEPILQMTCRDRNRLALQADLLFAYSRGINNVLCLTGDSVMLGDHKDRQGRVRPGLQPAGGRHPHHGKGQGPGGQRPGRRRGLLRRRHRHPGSRTPRAPADQVRKKIEAGAEFIQTQAVYDLDNFKTFMDTRASSTSRSWPASSC
jgi:methylenetetrahydrofolate reductase (NADPH)